MSNDKIKKKNLNKWPYLSSILVLEQGKLDIRKEINNGVNFKEYKYPRYDKHSLILGIGASEAKTDDKAYEHKKINEKIFRIDIGVQFIFESFDLFLLALIKHENAFEYL